MKRCKWSGDKSDNYCVSCDGIKMMVEGVQTFCTKCAGYEAGEEEIPEMNEPVNTDIPFEEKKQEAVPKAVKASTVKKATKTNKTTTETQKPMVEEQVKQNTTINNNVNNPTTTSTKVVETFTESQEETIETPEGVKVVSLNYTSGLTVRKDDDYYKFVAQEQWDVSNSTVAIDDIRSILWATLNNEIDKQIEQI